MNINRYISRINYTGNLNPNLAVLNALQKSHLLHIPFENLDIHYHKPINLSIDSIFDKIINQNRGGFCYELNGLFYALLISLGFDAKRVSARVYDQSKGYGPEYDHMAIVVNIEGTEYLTDVGFGEFTFGPLVLKEGLVQHDERGVFKIEKYKNDYLMVSQIEGAQVTPAYIFKNSDRKLMEFNPMCLFHQTSPDSHFTGKKLITRPTENGRITISGNNLKITKNNTVLEHIEFPLELFGEKLSAYFYIDESKLKGKNF